MPQPPYAVNEYPIDEKVPFVDVEAIPTFVVEERKRRSPARRLLRVALTVLSVFFLVNLFTTPLSLPKLPGGCHGHGNGMMLLDGEHHDHHEIDNWKPYSGTTHFEYEAAQASGITVTGGQAFGKVVFETSKTSDKVVVDLDIRTNTEDANHDISVVEKDGHLTIDTPKDGDLKTLVAAKVQIPSNIIGKFGLPKYELNLPRHMVDFSSLPESLEIGEFIIRLAKGYVKTGSVHTNTTDIKIADGGLRGPLTQARDETIIDVVKGNVTLDITKISSGDEGVSSYKLGNGDLKGSIPVYKSTTVDVIKGSIYIDVDFPEQDDETPNNTAELSTKIANGPVRVNVKSLAGSRIFKGYHTSISGDQLITYPENFEGTIDARGLAGNINLRGKDMVVEKVLGGSQGKKGQEEKNYVSVKAVKGSLDILVGGEKENAIKKGCAKVFGGLF